MQNKTFGAAVAVALVFVGAWLAVMDRPNDLLPMAALALLTVALPLFAGVALGWLVRGEKNAPQGL